MGAAAVPVIGSVIVGVLASKAVQMIGPKLGLSEDLTGIAATVAGVYAGGMTYDAATMQATSATQQVSADLAAPAQTTIRPGDADIARGVAPSSMANSGSTIQNAGLQSTGAETFPVGRYPPAVPPPGSTAVTTMPAAPTSVPGPHVNETVGMLPNRTADGLTQTGTGAGAKTATGNGASGDFGRNGGYSGTGEKTWYEKLYSNEKAWDMLMAAGVGYGSSVQAKDDREYDEKVAEKNAKGWTNNDPGGGGMLSLSHQYPSQA